MRKSCRKAEGFAIPMTEMETVPEMTDAAGAYISLIYDALNRVVKMIDAAGFGTADILYP